MKRAGEILKEQVLAIIGIILGAIGGYLYWHYIGCVSGTCPITSSPIMSTIWGALLGGLAAVALGLKFSDGAGLGAVSGGIGGIGGGAAAYRQRFTQSIASEIESKKFTSRNIYPNTTVTGVLFFPAGISGLKLHLPTKTVDIGFAY